MNRFLKAGAGAAAIAVFAMAGASMAAPAAPKATPPSTAIRFPTGFNSQIYVGTNKVYDPAVPVTTQAPTTTVVATTKPPATTVAPAPCAGSDDRRPDDGRADDGRADDRCADHRPHGDRRCGVRAEVGGVLRDVRRAAATAAPRPATSTRRCGA